jgi:hypothetical protein
MSFRQRLSNIWLGSEESFRNHHRIWAYGGFILVLLVFLSIAMVYKA